MKAFAIVRGKIKEIEVCRTKAEATLKVTGKVGYVVHDGAIVKVKEIFDGSARSWWRSHLVIIEGPKKRIGRTLFTRETHATARMAWSMYRAELRKDLATLTKDYRAEKIRKQRALRAAPAKGSVSAKGQAS